MSTIFLACPPDLLNNVLEIFNSLHERIQFTLEVGESNRLQFLDVTVIIADKKIIFDLYKKSTFSGKYINFYSHHPLAQKKAIVYNLVDKIIFLSNPDSMKRILRKPLIHCYIIIVTRSFSPLSVSD